MLGILGVSPKINVFLTSVGCRMMFKSIRIRRKIYELTYTDRHIPLEVKKQRLTLILTIAGSVPGQA